MASSPPGARSKWIWNGIAAVSFVCALAAAFDGYWGADLTTDAPVPNGRPMGRARAQDLHLTAWGTARNAWTFLHQPSRIFDAEPCYPEPNSLTTDHPRLTLGLVGIPFQLFTGDPVATFNGVVFASVLLAAFAMYLLVSDWTGVPAAGIVAAILYAFSTQQIEKTFHIMVTDNAWLLFALFFARRTLLQRRWRDAIALGMTAALQVGSSVYALLGAAAGAIPVVAWLLWRHPPDRRTLAKLAVAGAILAAGACFVLSPYAASGIGSITPRRQLFLPWSGLLPGNRFFPGWTTLALVVAALVLPVRGGLADPGRGARWALLLAALAVLSLATGGNQRALLLASQGGETPWISLPNAYYALATFLPGLNAVRLTKAIAYGLQPILCVLAGIGAASLLRRLPAHNAAIIAALLIAVALLDTLRPAFLGLAELPPFTRFRLAPSRETLDFFEALERRGNDGPMMEFPVLRQRPETGMNVTWRSELTEQHWLTAYHHRRTTSCSGSVSDRVVPGLEAATLRFATDPTTADSLRARGVTTVVVHHRKDEAFERSYANSVTALAKTSDGRLRRIGTSPEMTAYELHEPPGATTRNNPPRRIDRGTGPSR
jgi:hypothetical protein